MLNFIKWTASEMSAPKNQVQEIARHIILHNTEWLNYRIFAKLYHDLNAHKKIALMKENGFVFEERNKNYVSKYGFSRRYKEFRLVTPKKEAIEMYNKLTQVLTD